MAGAPLRYLESQRNAQPELADWYSTLAELYQKKLWHQLTLKLDQFVALAVVQVKPTSPLLIYLTWSEVRVSVVTFFVLDLSDFYSLKPKFVEDFMFLSVIYV